MQRSPNYDNGGVYRNLGQDQRLHKDLIKRQASNGIISRSESFVSLFHPGARENFMLLLAHVPMRYLTQPMRRCALITLMMRSQFHDGVSAARECVKCDGSDAHVVWLVC